MSLARCGQKKHKVGEERKNWLLRDGTLRPGMWPTASPLSPASQVEMCFQGTGGSWPPHKNLAFEWNFIISELSDCFVFGTQALLSVERFPGCLRCTVCPAPVLPLPSIFPFTLHTWELAAALRSKLFSQNQGGCVWGGRCSSLKGFQEIFSLPSLWVAGSSFLSLNFPIEPFPP